MLDAGPRCRRGQGLILDPGQRFRVNLTNDFAGGTIIHWHGQIPPNAQDGVPDMPIPLLAPGETRSYDFEARLIALDALPDRPVDRSHMLMLGGSMQPYVWTINGAVWGQH